MIPDAFVSFTKYIFRLKPAHKYLFWSIIFLLQAAFFIYGNSKGNLYLKDSSEYLNQAQNLLNHGTWYCGNFEDPLIPQLFSQRPPLYGFFILLLHLLLNNNVIISFAQSLLSLFNIWIAFRIIKTLTPDSLTAPFFLLPFLFFPSQFIYANFLMPEMLLQTFIMLAVYFLLDYFKNKKFNSCFYYQLFITAAFLTKPVYFLFPIISLLFFFLLKNEIQTKLKTILSHSIPLTAIFIVSFINNQHTGYYEYSSIPRKLAFNYNARYAAAYNHGEAFSLQQIDSIEQAAALLQSYPEKARYIETSAMNMIKENAGAYLILSMKGIANFFFDHSRYDLESFSGNIPEENKNGWRIAYTKNGFKGIINYFSSMNMFFFAYLFISMLFNLILLVGLFRFSRRKEIPLYARLILLTFILFTAILTGMTGTTRFRVPVFLLIVIANLIAWGQNYFEPERKSIPV